MGDGGRELNTKTCTTCRKEKDLELFSRDSQGKLGRKSRCKECIAESIKKWRSQPHVQERNRTVVKKYEANHPERKLLYSARDRAKRDGLLCTITVEDIVIPKICPVFGIILERGTRKEHDFAPSLDRIDPSFGYILTNIAIISDRANRIKNDGTAEEHRKISEWIISGPSEPTSCYNSSENFIKWMVSGARRRARKLGLNFEISRKDVIVPKTCPILGIPLVPGVGQRNRHDGSPTLDRRNPALGYVLGNIGVISYRANRIKNNGTAEEHLAIANWMDSMLSSKQIEHNYEEPPAGDFDWKETK